MEILDYQFPEATQAHLAFPTFDTPDVLLKEAKARGFFGGHTPANKLFNDWFFGGLEKAPEFKAGVEQSKAQRAMNWAVCYMRSFAPKHEHKEAVCALIFDAALEIPAT
jgi:hypothetical protein